MPSVLLTGQSGGMPVFSGSLGSGRQVAPQAGIQLVVDRNASGCVYVSLSGGVTVLSGSYPLSGGGQMDGVQLCAGAAYWIPRGALTNASGTPPNVYVACDAACSGQTRLFSEIF